jgi:hypothetical protein
MKDVNEIAIQKKTRAPSQMHGDVISRLQERLPTKKTIPV